MCAVADPDGGRQGASRIVRGEEGNSRRGCQLTFCQISRGKNLTNLKQMLAVAGVVLGAFYMYVDRPLQGYHGPHIHYWQLQVGTPACMPHLSTKFSLFS